MHSIGDIDIEVGVEKPKEKCQKGHSLAEYGGGGRSGQATA